jgi:hypothetical protein
VTATYRDGTGSYPMGQEPLAVEPLHAPAGPKQGVMPPRNIGHPRQGSCRDVVFGPGNHPLFQHHGDGWAATLPPRIFRDAEPTGLLAYQP